MVPISATPSSGKPSFAKIAAAGLKPPNSSKPLAVKGNAQKSNRVPSLLNVTPSASDFTKPGPPALLTQDEIVHSIAGDAKDKQSEKDMRPEVQIHRPEPISAIETVQPILTGMLTPGPTDEAGTQISSSTGSGKALSLDGKSIASATTFALDEKESLRPDDSASVKAGEDEEAFSQIDAPRSGSGPASEDGARAFSDQLREIYSMEPLPDAVKSQDFGLRVQNAPRVLYVPPTGSGVGTVPGSTRPSFVQSNQAEDFSPDLKLMEAMDSPKDRIMVLKLEQDLADFVKDVKESSLKLPQTNAFYRMLAHKLAEYFMLGHSVDESTMAVRIYKTPNCRLPPPLTSFATPSTATSTPPPIAPQMKILRRGFDNAGPTIANGSNFTSKTTSENGESGGDDEKKAKFPPSREEREARYEAARKRIMGSAKPPESADETVEVDMSRSSSAAGKKTKKKQRSDSDDDFEARSAYSAYYATPFSSAGPPTPSYGLAGQSEASNGHLSAAHFGAPGMPGAYQQFGMPTGSSWPAYPYNQQRGPNDYIQQQQASQPPFDLSGNFHQAMSFQSPPAGPQSPGLQQGYGVARPPQHGNQHQPWLAPNSYLPSYVPRPSSNGMEHYATRPPSASGPQQMQPYAFGQLPSQTYPGRPWNKLEHPLPGSYRSKHFNPQSQAFVPTQASGPNASAFGSSATQSSVQPFMQFAMPSPLQRQDSTPAGVQPSGQLNYSSPAGHEPQRLPTQSMLQHPLPQPVFPQLPSPSVPLPAKPQSTPPKVSAQTHQSSGAMPPNAGPAAPSASHSSSIAKWGAPASLPAKPPPAAEPFDQAKYSQAQRQSTSSAPAASVATTTTSAARLAPTNGMPSFGSMPPMAVSRVALGGQGAQSDRRL